MVSASTLMPLLFRLLSPPPFGFHSTCLIILLPRVSPYSLSSRYFNTRRPRRLAATSTVNDMNEPSLGDVDDEFMLKLKEHRKNKAPKRLLEDVVAMNSRQNLNLNMTYYAIRTLQRMNRTDLATSLIPIGQTLIPTDQYTSSDISIGVAMVKLCCKNGDMDQSLSIAQKFGVYLHSAQDKSAISGQEKVYEAFLPEIAFGFASTKSFQDCLNVLHLIQKLEFRLPDEIAKNILKTFVRGEGNMNIRNALRAIAKTSHGPQSDTDIVQILCSHYLRSLDFIKGAVSMSTLPPESCPEVCFIGRSNVPPLP